MEEILKEINELRVEDFKNCWNSLRELSIKAISLMSPEDVYRGDKQALEGVVWVLDRTQNGISETWLFHVFRNKRLHAIDAITKYQKRLASPFKYAH